MSALFDIHAQPKRKVIQKKQDVSPLKDILPKGWSNEEPNTNTHAEVSVIRNGGSSLILGNYTVGVGWKDEFGNNINPVRWIRMR